MGDPRCGERGQEGLPGSIALCEARGRGPEKGAASSGLTPRRPSAASPPPGGGQEAEGDAGLLPAFLGQPSPARGCGRRAPVFVRQRVALGSSVPGESGPEMTPCPDGRPEPLGCTGG